MLNNANLALILSLLADRANPQQTLGTGASTATTQHYEITQGADGSTTLKITIESKPQTQGQAVAEQAQSQPQQAPQNPNPQPQVQGQNTHAPQMAHLMPQVQQVAQFHPNEQAYLHPQPHPQQANELAPQPQQQAQGANLSTYHPQASQVQGQMLTGKPQAQAVGLAPIFTSQQGQPIAPPQQTANHSNLSISPFNVLAVDYEQNTIYGHTTKGIDALMGAIKRFWTNHDPKQADTMANKNEIAEWIVENYSVSKSQAMEIQRIIRPQEAQHLGRRV